MHRFPKSLSNTRFVPTQLTLSLRQLNARSSSRCHPKSDNDDNIHRREDNEGAPLHLYKSKGQHILTNPRVLDSIVRKSHIKPIDTVLEIGPGTGNLTLRLLQAARKVVAVEIDKRMVEILHKRVAEKGFEDQLTVICKDALRTVFPQFDLVVANIPYGISSPLVAKLVYGDKPFRSATLLLQKEFARRLLANPGDSEFNRLAVNVKLVADVEFVMDVSKRDFVPCPKVDSSVVIIRPKAEIPDVNLDECNNAAAADDDEEVDSDEVDCYSSSCLETQMSVFKDKIIGVLKSGGFEAKRPSKLCNKELLHLLALFNQAGIYFHDQSKPRIRDADNIELAPAFSS
nr:ribosomal rna small subunit methyltransferase, mitochondrial [Quercus suber]